VPLYLSITLSFERLTIMAFIRKWNYVLGDTTFQYDGYNTIHMSFPMEFPNCALQEYHITSKEFCSLNGDMFMYYCMRLYINLR